jgi:rhodanese-related sulfurtransferase
MRRKLALFCLLAITGSTAAIHAQYKNDNVLYRLVYLQDLCKTLNGNPGYLLLDVRSEGEYEDTSSFSSLNIGRFKNAVNIPVQDLGSRLKEIKNYKEQPVFVYCSHSQRSRRASKMLADSGFQKIFNVNSGLSSTHLLSTSSLECILAKTEMNTPYNILSPQDLSDRLSKGGNNLFLLDVRPDSIYNAASGNEKMNVYGTIKGSMHISRNDLEGNINRLPANKEIIVIDAFGDESAKAATWLSNKGYKNVSILFNGIDAWLTTPVENLPGKMIFLEQRAAYTIFAASEFSAFIRSHPEHLFLDVRTKEEFSNQAKDYWRNIGKLKDAINIPSNEFAASRNELAGYQNKPIIVYSFSGSDDAYRTARKLTDAGFKDVSVLAGGIFNLRWTAHNTKGKESIADIVVNVPDINL